MGIRTKLNPMGGKGESTGESLLPMFYSGLNGNTSCYVTENGYLYMSGRNDEHQQGSGNTTRVYTFTQRASNVKDVVCSQTTTWYITTSGDLYGCGSNNTINESYFTKKASNVVKVACSNDTTWYITTSGDLYGCGRNDYGQQGSGNTTNVTTFTKRASNVKDVVCTSYSTWYIDKNDNLYGCGSNQSYQQGNGGSGTYVSSFTQKPSNVAKVVLGDGNSPEQEAVWILKTNGDLSGCGYNGQGQQGNGNTNNVANFSLRASNVKDVVCWRSSTYYLSENGGIYATGSNYGGCLGLGDTTNRNSFTLIPNTNNKNIKAMFAGLASFGFIEDNGNFYMCGYNTFGQQSTGDTSNVKSLIQKAYNVKSIFLTELTSWYIDENNTLYGCGDGTFGEQGNGSGGTVYLFENKTNYLT